jgi:uncharacterized membrane protein
MKTKFKYLFLGLVLILSFNQEKVFAQCAMCKTSVESNQHEQKFIAKQKAEGLNTGILYLMVLPYLMFCIIGYFWYISSKKENAKKIKISSVIERVKNN